MRASTIILARRADQCARSAVFGWVERATMPRRGMVRMAKRRASPVARGSIRIGKNEGCEAPARHDTQENVPRCGSDLVPGYEGSPGRLGGFVRGSLLYVCSSGCGSAVWLTAILHRRYSRASRLSCEARQIVRTCIIGWPQLGHGNEFKPTAAGTVDPFGIPQPSPESRRAALRQINPTR